MALRPKLILTLVVGLLLTACKTPETQTHQIWVLYDVTSSTQDVLPSSDKVLGDISKIYPMQVGRESPYLNDGFEIGISFFDELSSGRITEKRLNPNRTSAAMGNPKKRAREVKAFFTKVHEFISAKLSDTPTDRPHSKIYSKICRVLNKLAHSDADTKHLIIYTDLFENSELANFYHEKTLRQAADNPSEFAKQYFEPHCKMADLDGITIHLYPYRTAGTDAAVNLAEKFWVSLLESGGAEVEVDP